MYTKKSKKNSQRVHESSLVGEEVLTVYGEKNLVNRRVLSVE